MARLAAGSVVVNKSVSRNNTFLSQIFTKTEPNIKAVVKRLTPRQLANELIASLLAQYASLPTPRSFLVLADPKYSLGGTDYKHSSGYLMYFGSEISSASTLINFFNADDIMAFAMIDAYQDWGKLLAFDEWTANVDRHLNNYMFDGQKIILFDHDRCLTGDDWVPTNLDPMASYPCHPRIDQIHSAMPKTSKDRARIKSSEMQTDASKINIGTVIDEIFAVQAEHGVPQDLPAAASFLKNRVGQLFNLCGIRLN